MRTIYAQPEPAMAQGGIPAETRSDLNGGSGACPASPSPPRPPNGAIRERMEPGVIDLSSARTRDKSLVDMLIQSPIYIDFENAFGEATGLPMVLRPVESWQLPLHGKKRESPFCALVAQKSSSCTMCLQLQQKLAEAASTATRTLSCPFGLSDTAAPIRVGERLIGYLQTGQVFCKRPAEPQFQKALRLLGQPESKDLKDAFFATRVLPQKQYDAMVTMLSIFGQHLSMVSNQVLVRHENAEPQLVRRAKDFIMEHQSEELSLDQVARVANTSTFYFCKMFKKSTGLNFTEYVSRVRVEKAKNLLLNPNLRISEIAFEVGFQSLTHFNRVFKKLAGLSPTEYRDQLPVV